ncbi:MAG TPA: glutamate racemase [Longimicrobium sp.]
MTAPVGIFDSGVGGLSVAREIRRALPAEHLLYVSDAAYVPYGDRGEDEVRARTLAIGEWIQSQGAKVLVVACNTASGAALEALRERLHIPVIGLEPALKPAVRATRVGRVGVMATRGTLASARFQRLVDNYADGVQVVRDPCPGLADLVEDGMLAGPELEARMEAYVAPLREAGVDTVVLGCTHYVFVRDTIQRALGPDVRLLDSGEAIARRARQILAEAGALQPDGPGSLRFLTTGEPLEVAAVVQRLWGEPMAVEHLEV